MIHWINPKEQLPEEGQMVWVLLYHWKEKGPMSSEMICGIAESSGGAEFHICTNDDTGKGSYGPYLVADDAERPFLDYGRAWAPVDEINLPEWLYGSHDEAD